MEENVLLNQRKSVLMGWLVCILAAVFYCYEYLLRIMPSVMMPKLMQNFHITATGLGLITTAYYVGYSPMQLLVGAITDRFGSRRVLLCALTFCVIGSFVFAYFHLFHVAIFGRLLIGIGSAFAFVAVLRLAAIWLPVEHFSVFVGLATTLGMVGAMIGDVGMSALVGTMGWRHVIYLGGFFGCLLIPLFICFIHEGQTGQADQKNTTPNIFSNTKEVLFNRHVVFSGLIGCVLYLSLSVVADNWGIIYMQTKLHTTKIYASSLNMMIYCGWLVGAPLMGWLSEYLQVRRLLLRAGCLLAAIAFAMILLLPITNSALLMTLLFLFGFFSSVEILCFVLAREQVRLEQTATAIGVINFFVMLGGMLLLPLVGGLLDYFWNGQIQNGIRVYHLGNYQHVLLFVPVLYLVACLLTFVIRDAGE